MADHLGIDAVAQVPGMAVGQSKPDGDVVQSTYYPGSAFQSFDRPKGGRHRVVAGSPMPVCEYFSASIIDSREARSVGKTPALQLVQKKVDGR